MPASGVEQSTDENQSNGNRKQLPTTNGELQANDADCSTASMMTSSAAETVDERREMLSRVEAVLRRDDNDDEVVATSSADVVDLLVDLLRRENASLTAAASISAYTSSLSKTMDVGRAMELVGVVCGRYETRTTVGDVVVVVDDDAVTVVKFDRSTPTALQIL